MKVPERIDALPLLLPLHERLVELLRGLTPAQWETPTVCAGWTAKDVAAHLLDTDLRKLSAGRDGHRCPPERCVRDYADLVDYLNRLNEDWVRVTRRLSPAVIVQMQALSGPQVVEYWHRVDMDAPAHYGVAWAGEEQSPNWFDCAREYTERWHHQQQIRDVVDAEGLTGRKWLYPVLATFVRALPVTYRDVQADVGTRILFEIEGDAGGAWTLQREPGVWTLFEGRSDSPDATVRTQADTARRIFTKGLSLAEADRKTEIRGDSQLGSPFLKTLAVIAIRSEDET